MTSDDEFLRRLKPIVNSLERWGNLADAKAVEEVAARIRELEAELKKTRCPIGLDDSPMICSASSCYRCMARRLKTLYRAAQPAASD